MFSCCLKDVVIVDAWLHLSDTQDVMPFLTQTVYDLAVNTLIR